MNCTNCSYSSCHPKAQVQAYAIIHQAVSKKKKTQKRLSFGSSYVFSHGRWSPRSRDLGAKSSSVFSTRYPTSSLPLSLCIPQAGIIAPLSGPPPTIGSPPACNALFSPGCARSTEHPPRLQIGLSFLTPHSLSLC